MKKLASYGTYGLHIIEFPSGRFGFVGTVPEVLIKDAPRSWATAEEAETFFNAKKHLIK